MYGLIGKKLNYSLSKEIHKQFLQDNYELIETDDLSKINIKSYNGLNITNPFKSEIIKYLDQKDEIVEKTNACNLVINQKGKLIGYNTDYYGFVEMLKFHNIDLKNKKVLICGNGCTSRTIQTVLDDLNIDYVVSGRQRKSEKEKLYAELKDEYDVIINATPVGINEDKSIVDLYRFNQAKLVIDINYSPFRSKLLIDAKRLKKEYVNGLYMLVAQAKKSEEIFTNKNIDKTLEIAVYKNVFKQTTKVVFIGMPYTGKTTTAKRNSVLNNVPFVDLDELIKEKYGCSPKEIIKSKSEEEFRLIEEKTMLELCTLRGGCIALGGGSITNKNAMNELEKSSVFVYLDHNNPETIKFDDTRPLSTNLKEWYNLLNARKRDFYFYFDIKINAFEEIDIYEVINNQWTKSKYDWN